MTKPTMQCVNCKREIKPDERAVSFKLEKQVDEFTVLSDELADEEHWVHAACVAGLEEAWRQQFSGSR